MPTISSLNPARAPCKIIAISIGLLSTILLASCGGGGSTDPNATAQSADDGTKTIQAVSGSTAVPGTWTGRAPKMEVINGITVPPEPAPSINNATLAGVDVNNNGVRDDVERAVARLSVTRTSFDVSMLYASKLSGILRAETPTTPDDAKKLMLSPECSVSGSSSLVQIKYTRLIFNTPERISKIKAVAKLVPAMSAEEVANYACP